jgi:UDP-galactopyranose mutase
MNYDFLIVGSGLTGAVIAHMLRRAGSRVLVLERRHHLGGNVYDHFHPSGIRVHTYGPHYFRTDDDLIWEFVNRFTEFYPYEAVIKSFIDGRYENWPVAGSYIRRAVGNDWKPDFFGEPTCFEEAARSKMPRLVYEKFVRDYTEKQWGISARCLGPQLTLRFPVHEDDDPRLVRHKHQGIPSCGYAKFMSNILSGIPVILKVNYLEHRSEFRPLRKVIYSGPIDEYFGFDLGRLKYRGQMRHEKYFANLKYALPCGQVNNPDPCGGPHIRTLEWKHMMPPETADLIRGTVLTSEIPYSPSDPVHYEYPFPDDKNARLYESYRRRAMQIPDVLFCGRLGEYRYYDMDQAISNAMSVANRLLSGCIE